MPPHRPTPSSRRYAERVASSIGQDIDTSRCAIASSIDDVSRRAHLSPSTVVRVLRGDAGVHLDTLCAVAAAVGLRISVKTFPAQGPSLRDIGQLRIVERIIGLAHPSLQPAMELPVGDAFGRAADLVFFAPREIIHFEVERRLPDWQAPYRAAALKRDALQAQHQRPVRLVIAVADTRRNRALLEPHLHAIKLALPAGTADIVRAVRDGTPLGRDGLLWVRTWRDLRPRSLPDR